MPEHRAKRPAVEPPEALIGHEAEARATAAGGKRPISLALGAAFVLGRAVASAFWFLGFSLVWPATAAELDLDHESAAIVHWVVGVVVGIGILVLLLFGWLIWRGSNTARVITMCVLTISILSSAIGYFAAGEEITVQTTLLTVALDILVLLALSSREARAWARRPRAKRARGA